MTWISGWGVDPLRWRAAALEWRPAVSHVFLPPRLGAAEMAADSDIVVAWSLGAWRVLSAASSGVVFSGRAILLAPFVAFCAEHGMGGKCAQSQVRWLRRWILRDGRAALADFHQRAGLGTAPADTPYPLVEMLEGLDRLAEDASPALRQFAARGLPPGWAALVGDQDALLNAEAVCRALPGCRIVSGGTHAPETLLPVVKESLRAV